MNRLTSILSILITIVFASSNIMYGQTFNSIRHHVSASFIGNDPYGDDFPMGSDSITNQAFEPFYGNLNLTGGGAQSECSLSSDLDPVSGVFYAYGHSSSGLYVQGSASSQSESSFQTVFRLNRPGSVSFTGVIGVSQFLGSYQTHDEPGSAQVILRIRNLNTNQNVVNKIIKMNGYINDPSGLIQVSLDELGTVSLATGRYRLLIEATSKDSAIQEEIGGSIAVGFYEVEGVIVDN